MNFNLVEMYNGLLRFNKHILNELAEGLKHLLMLGGSASNGSAGSGGFYSVWVQSASYATAGFFTTVKLD